MEGAIDIVVVDERGIGALRHCCGFAVCAGVALEVSKYVFEGVYVRITVLLYIC
jgi:hypothetical protein